MSDVPNIPDDALSPKSIVDWEVKHGIVRVMRDGVMYVQCTDLEAFIRQTEAEKEAQRREWLNQKIAEEQAAAYFGTGESSTAVQERM